MSSPLTLQQLAGAADRLAQRHRATSSTDWLQLVQQAALSLRQFSPQPLLARREVVNDKARLLVDVQPVDRLIEEALMPTLRRAFEPLFSAAVHGYRKGRSSLTAAMAAVEALAAGHHHLALLDVEDCFPRIDRALLRASLAAHLPAATVELLAALHDAPFLVDGALISHEKGLALGRPTSPPLANFYLLPLDRAMAGLAVTYLRYADDILLAAAAPEQLEGATRALEEALGGLGLSINQAKARRLTYEGTPLIYLGHAVHAEGIYRRVPSKQLDRIRVRRGAPIPRELQEEASEPDALLPLNQRCRTVYITEPGLYLHTHQGLMVIKRGDETLREIPLHRVDRVLILAGGLLSSGFMAACISHKIPVLFFVGKGKAYGSLVSGGMPNPLRLQAQYELISSPARRLALAVELIEKKLQAMMKRLAGVPGVDRQIDAIKATLERLPSATDGEQVRGHEGLATRSYYEAWSTRIKPARKPTFDFRGRSRRPPRDPLNCLLSFTYSLIFGEMQTSLLAHGLDPHPGLLHNLQHNHPALASDLIEPYRVIIADTFVLTVINNGQFKAEDFEPRSDGGVYLKDDPRRRLLASYEEHMARPVGSAGGTPRSLIDAAALCMLRVTLGEVERLDLPLSATLFDSESETP